MIQYDVPMDAGRVAAIARAYLLENQLSDLLEENGGNFKVGETWCLGILKEMDYSRRKCTTQAAKLPADWEIKGKRLTLQVCDPSHAWWTTAHTISRESAWLEEQVPKSYSKNNVASTQWHQAVMNASAFSTRTTSHNMHST